MQVHSLRLDSRSGQFTVDQVTARFNAARRSLSLTEKGATRGITAAVAGTQVGKVSIGPAREFNTAGLFTALPPNALTTTAGVPVQTFTLNTSYEFEHVGTPGRVPTIVSITIPPAIRDQEVLNRFATATRGVQATWARCLRRQTRRGAGHRLPARAGRDGAASPNRSGLDAAAATGVDGLGRAARGRQGERACIGVPAEEGTRSVTCS